jgi:hypothetical protein
VTRRIDIGDGRAVFDASWRRRACVRPLIARLASEMVFKHYLRKWPAVPRLHLGLFIDSKLQGCVIFAEAPRETSKRYGGYTWELARLWVSDDIPRNVETWLISKCVRYIARRHPEVRFLVSYADPQAGHIGTIYRAANWKPDGMTDDGCKKGRAEYVNPESGKVYGRRSHVPSNVVPVCVERVRKYRFVLALQAHKRILDAAPLFTQTGRKPDAELFGEAT